MPRSSRSKSHKQSKHSSKEASAAAAVREYSDSDEDVKMKDRNNNNGSKEDAVSVRVSKDTSVSGEKRKLGKDLSGSHGNGDVSEEYTTSSKRRKEKSHGGSDRWNGGGCEEKEEVAVNIDNKESVKLKDSSKVGGESKSKSRRHDVESTSVATPDKDRGDSSSKRRSEKESGRKEGHQHKDSKESKDKDRGSDRERKFQEGKREAETLKQVEDQPIKRGRENTEWPIEEEMRNPELEKELEKRIRRRGEGSAEKDKYYDDLKETDDRRLSTRSDRSKDVKHKDDKHKDEGYGDKYKEEGDRESRHRDDKYREDGERDNKSRDVVKYRGESERDNKQRDDKSREDGERDRHREDKYREDGNRDSRFKEEKHREDGDRDNRHRDEKYKEGADRDERNRDDKHRQDEGRGYRRKDEKHREDVDRDHRHRDGRPRDDIEREKRVRDSKYRDVHTSRDHLSESDTKRLRDESNSADLYHRKANNREGSPVYDDRAARYKDDKDRRRGNDKDEPNDYRSRSTKEQRSDSEKRSTSSAKVEPDSERGRPTSRNVDTEITANHSRRRSSPSGSSYPARDHYRVSKQEESKYRDYQYEERGRHNVTTGRDFTSAPGQSDKLASRSLEKISQKDDNYMGELSVERRLRSDARSSPLVDKSPSSTSNERRPLNRPDARRSLDVEESGQRSGGSKDAKEHSAKDGKGSHNLAMDRHPDNDLSQVDGDSLSVSSPYARSGHFSGNSKALLPPPPPYRTGPDSPLGFGSSEDDRSKSNNRHRRMGDPNMGRAQSWKNVPNWPSPLANGGYIPFQHVPTPIGFHPVMQQFPPIFGRPPMKVNHSGVPYHIPDSDRFSGHGRPLQWRNQVDESIPPPLHGWDANNPVFGDESHVYGRLDWDRGRSQLSNRGWESSTDLWKGQNIGASLELQSAPQKDDYSAQRHTDETWSGQTGQHIENEQNQLDIQSETMNLGQSCNSLERIAPEAPKVTESPYISEVGKEDDTLLSQVYLSKIDLSEDLTQPDLYGQCASMIDMDQETLSDEYDYKILFVEEGKEAKLADSASLFAAINDSVFQKAMCLYKKQREEFGAMNGGEQVSYFTANEPELVTASDHDKGCSVNDGKSEDREEVLECAVPEVGQEKHELPTQKLDIGPVNEAIVTDMIENCKEQIPTSDKVYMEVDRPVVKQESDIIVEEEIPPAPEENHAPPIGGLLPCKIEEVNEPSIEVRDSNHDDDKEDELLDTNYGGPLIFSDVSTATEAVMPESIEFRSVNLNRIQHHSPESTH